MQQQGMGFQQQGYPQYGDSIFDELINDPTMRDALDTQHYFTDALKASKGYQGDSGARFDEAKMLSDQQGPEDAHDETNSIAHAA